jgi:uncharacterized protein YmfQ (DUF2313 family)
MGLSAEQYLSHLQALMPLGAAWSREPGSDNTSTLAALAQELARVDARCEDLARESDVRAADEMLADWERLLGLPDDCMAGQALSVIDRRLIATQRLVEQGGQSAAYFIALAALLGETGCTVTEFRPFNCNGDCNDALYSQSDRFVWRMNIARPANNARFANCNDDCNDALQAYTPSLIECPINERKPAHTTVLFAYSA